MLTARVLVVDDEKLVRWSACERLGRRGCETASAESGEQALELVASFRPQVMLLDVRLPGLQGLEVLRRALVLDPDLAIVMISAHGTVDTAVDAMKHGALDFLVKPFPLDALDAAVERALSASRTRQAVASLGSRAGGDARGLPSLVGPSSAMDQLRTMIARVAATETATVLIEGESGAGKEAVARAIHYESARAERPLMQINCAAVPEQLLESELFGHERGSFTDARERKRGLFESAAGGSVMLDEIGDLPAAGQAKLLRLLEDKSFRRVGGLDELRADVRVIAATNADLERRVSEGRFRADLYFRLNVVRLVVPPLRERPEDVAPLAAHFIARFNREMKRHVTGLAPEADAAMRAYAWPGNVRELRNAVERAFVLHPAAAELRREHLPPHVLQPRPAALAPRQPFVVPGTAPALPASAPLVAPAPATGGSTPPLTGLGLEEAERRMIAEALQSARGNQSQAARLLCISRDTLRYRMKKHGFAGG